MITILLNSNHEDKKFKSYVRRELKATEIFDVLVKGNKLLYAAAVLRSTEKIVKKDYYGKVIDISKANDDIVVCSSLLLATNETDFYIELAKDADLEYQIIKYNG